MRNPFALTCWLMFSAALAGPRADAAPPLARSGVLAEGVGLSLRGKDATRPAAAVKIGKVTVGAQRLGFFRVAALPLVVGEGVAIRFHAADASALADLPKTFAAIARTDALELHRVAWFAPGSEQPMLRAESVEVDGADAWKLTGVEWADGTRAATATLHLAGKRTGSISWAGDTGTLHRPLFQTTP